MNPSLQPGGRVRRNLRTPHVGEIAAVVDSRPPRA